MAATNIFSGFNKNSTLLSASSLSHSSQSLRADLKLEIRPRVIIATTSDHFTCFSSFWEALFSHQLQFSGSKGALIDILKIVMDILQTKSVNQILLYIYINNRESARVYFTGTQNISKKLHLLSS